MSAEKELLARVNPLAREYAMFPPGGAILCAVSGGVDSMSLLHFLRRRAECEGFSLHACHLNHSIRPEAGSDAAFVRARCKALGVPLHERTADIPALAAEAGRGLEETGRIERYRFFEETAALLGEDCLIATAHNADDNAETLLLHLVRGSGLSGLGGIPPRRGNLVRPFLNVPRSLIEAYAAEQNVPHVEDATNADPAYTRNFLRLRVMPLLREMNPGLTDTLSASAASLRRDGDYLTARARAVAMEASIAAGSVILPVAAVNSQPGPIALRVVQCAVERLSPETVLTAAQRGALVELCRSDDPGAHLDLPGKISAQRVYGDLVLSFAGGVEVLPPTLLDFAGTREIGPWIVTVERGRTMPAEPHRSRTSFYLAEGSPVLLRPRKTGDTLHLPNRVGKSVKKWMIEFKIPEARRALIPVLEQDGRAAAVYGVGAERDALPQPGAPCIYISIREKERK